MPDDTWGPFELRTERLLLRAWRDEDLAPFAAMNADPRVMEFFERPMTWEESESSLVRGRALMAARGFTFWPVEVVGGPAFVGMVGLAVADFTAPFTPCVEIGWRLAADFWGRGYATEAARAALAFGFERLELDEIVAFTTVANARSRRVMDRLGMTRSPDEDFMHPKLPDGHPIKPHVLYRLPRARWSPG